MKKNIFKKAGRVFTSLALAVSICLTMSVSVFAKNGNDLENKNINYRDYLYFVIDGKDYKMTDLTTEPGVDLSGSNVSAEVYAKVDMDGLNAAMKASGSIAVWASFCCSRWLRHVRECLWMSFLLKRRRLQGHGGSRGRRCGLHRHRPAVRHDR